MNALSLILCAAACGLSGCAGFDPSAHSPRQVCEYAFSSPAKNLRAAEIGLGSNSCRGSDCADWAAASYSMHFEAAHLTQDGMYVCPGDVTAHNGERIQGEFIANPDWPPNGMTLSWQADPRSLHAAEDREMVKLYGAPRVRAFHRAQKAYLACVDQIPSLGDLHGLPWDLRLRLTSAEASAAIQACGMPPSISDIR